LRFLTGEEEVLEMDVEMATALAELTSKGADSIIVDIRGNDGGEDDQAPMVINFFLPPGAPKTLKCHFILNLIFLPRQARDKHRESTQSLPPPARHAQAGVRTRVVLESAAVRGEEWKAT